jgi:hypothetical protein
MANSKRARSEKSRTQPRARTYVAAADLQHALERKGYTHLSYKQEHVVDLETEAILSAEIYYGNESDANTLLDSVGTAQGNLQQADIDAEIKEVVADKGYHKNETLAKSSGQNTPPICKNRPSRSLRADSNAILGRHLR